MQNDWRRIYSWWTVAAIVAIFGVTYLDILYPSLNEWGMSPEDATLVLPGDGAADGLVATSTRGVTINAPANEVWQWVVQLGQERAGFYSNDWLENLTLADIHNADKIHPEWQSRKAGDKVYGAGGPIYGKSAFWTLNPYQPGVMMYLWGPIVVQPITADSSRLIARTYAAPASPTLQPILAFTFDWMHFVMERGMLLGIKARAEGTYGVNTGLRTLATLGWIVAALLIALVLFVRRRGWWWGLIPLAYAAAILLVTGDFWSALAGFLWWGIIVAGFVVWGWGWWKGLILAVVAAVLTFVLADEPFIAFGIIFWVVCVIGAIVYAYSFMPARSRAVKLG